MPLEGVGAVEKIGKYQILEKIGEGAMGVVYRAMDPIIERIVAVKTMSADLDADPDLRTRFFREARSAGQLSHKNIITIYELGEEGARAYMAMEFLEGEDLRRKIAHREPMSLEEKMRVMNEVCEGIAHAHSKDVIHRDIKPGNIFITLTSQVKILDFGLARIASSDVTKAGTVMGTPSYMSPEQVRGDRVDHRSDIFSLGSVCYELLTGRKPFNGPSLPATFFKIIQEEPDFVSTVAPSVPRELGQIVHRALAKDPDRRYQTVGEIIVALDHVRQEPLAQRTTVQPRPPRRDSISVEVAEGSVPTGTQRLSRHLLVRAEECAARGDVDGAVALLESATPSLLADVQTQEALARFRNELRTREEARQRNAQVEERLDLGRRAFESGDHAVCAELMGAILAISPDHAEAAELLARARQALEEQREAERRREEIARLLRSADSAFAAGKREKAAREAARALELAPEDEQARFLRDRIAQQIEEERLTRERQGRAESLVREARGHLSSANLAEAAAAVDEAVRLWPQVPGASKVRQKIERAEAERSAKAKVAPIEPETTTPIKLRSRGVTRWQYVGAAAVVAGALIAGIIIKWRPPPKPQPVVHQQPAAIRPTPARVPAVVTPPTTKAPDPAVEAAVRLLSQGRAAEAAREAQRALARDPANNAAQSVLNDARKKIGEDAVANARNLLSAGRYGDARTLVNQAFRDSAPSEDAHRLLDDIDTRERAAAQEAETRRATAAAHDQKAAGLSTPPSTGGSRVTEQQPERRTVEATRVPAPDISKRLPDGGTADVESQKAEGLKVVDEARVAMEGARRKATGENAAAMDEVTRAQGLAGQGKYSEAAAAYRRAAGLYEANANSTARAQTELLDLLRQYSAAIQSRNIAGLKAIWPGLSAQEEKRIRDSFAFTRALAVGLKPVSYQVTGVTATVICERTDELVTLNGQKASHKSTATFTFRNRGGSWIIEAIR